MGGGSSYLEKDLQWSKDYKMTREENDWKCAGGDLSNFEKDLDGLRIIE